MDAAAVRAKLLGAAAVLRDPRATGAERVEASAIMAWLEFVPNPEDRRLIGAWSSEYTPEQVAEAIGVEVETVRRRFKSAIATIVARLASG